MGSWPIQVLFMRPNNLSLFRRFFSHCALELLQKADEEDYYLAGLLLFRAQPEFGGLTCIDLAHANDDYLFISHHAVQRVFDQVFSYLCEKNVLVLKEWILPNSEKTFIHSLLSSSFKFIKGYILILQFKIFILFQFTEILRKYYKLKWMTCSVVEHVDYKLENF